MKFKSLVGVCTLLFSVLIITACSKADEPIDVTLSVKARPAKIITVQSAALSAMRTYPGTLESNQQADIAFRVSGQLVELPARPGMRVKRGDLLAKLDAAEFNNTLAAQEARYELAKIQHDQASALLKKKIASQLQYDQAVAEMRSAKASLDQARDNLAYTRLLAPFDGVVARVSAENYQSVQAKLPILQLQDNSRLDLHFSVPESLIAQLKVVDNPEVINSYCGVVTFSTRPGTTYRACHKEHESVPDPVTRNYAAVFTLEPIKDFSVLPGMTATIALDFSLLFAETDNNGLLVPVEAVFEKEGQRSVWRVDENGQARLTPVEVGRFEGEQIEITAGLKVADQVIAAGVTAVSDGMLVKPLVKERGL
ncbi:efflux RND transporter periplasmic adaptor subunit [Sedimenticola selenatireducens]|uniref:Efflux RND transporter periplasmic adaptor subunit n=1 Tax=Sedimenticola selenatireducens TaxID=191960 RepID=A0A557SKA1_9GAMM|nr:efflux RND transporter periplasmic adaptor subunit [Sedimenticola selenatireducens]TVO77839.1 efflux RND transporter periplasmic adaptor subunit [Sedimenticola selenatireducens]TVT65144.1 MAG: efflux RND transporter periplasmic adaptor subunit [Sedimenticola selenatireducens]